MIAVDVMGGDYAPREAVLGALSAAEKGIALTLFGNQDKVIPLLVQHNSRWRTLPIEIVHCSDVIDMCDDPLKGILRKKNSSIVAALRAVYAGTAHAFVSAGNSGAVVAAASIIIGRVPHIIRPAIAGFIPSSTGSFLCVDLGANPDCKPEHLLQFGYMGYAYARIMKHIACPKIALLSNGHEPYKGSMLVRDTFKLLQNSQLNFVGNIESNDIFSSDIDIVVTDGFTGNILLKSIQGVSRTLIGWMHNGASRSLWSYLLSRLTYPFFTYIRNKCESSRTGGALLLGINAPVIIAHGSSKATDITAAISVAHYAVQRAIIPLFNSVLTPLVTTNKVEEYTVVSQPHVQQRQL